MGSGKCADLQFELFGKQVDRIDFRATLKDPVPKTIKAEGGNVVDALCGKYEAAKRDNLGGSAMIYCNGAFICWVQDFKVCAIEPSHGAPKHQHGAVIVVKLTKKAGLPAPNKTKLAFEFAAHRSFFTAVKTEMESFMDQLVKSNPLFGEFLRVIAELKFGITMFNRTFQRQSPDNQLGIIGVSPLGQWCRNAAQSLCERPPL